MNCFHFQEKEELFEEFDFNKHEKIFNIFINENENNDKIVTLDIQYIKISLSTRNCKETNKKIRNLLYCTLCEGISIFEYNNDSFRYIHLVSNKSIQLCKFTFSSYPSFWFIKYIRDEGKVNRISNSLKLIQINNNSKYNPYRKELIRYIFLILNEYISENNHINDILLYAIYILDLFILKSGFDISLHINDMFYLSLSSSIITSKSELYILFYNKSEVL